jgi:hypothetical protein
MSQPLTKLANQAIDEFEEIRYLQELPRICSEQLGLKAFDEQKETVQHRVGLLLSCYMQRAELAIHELKLTLEEIRHEIAEQTRAEKERSQAEIQQSVLSSDVIIVSGGEN